MPRTLTFALALVVTFVTNHVAAHDVPPTYDRINFQVSATQEVENDTLVAVMYHERTGQQPRTLADDVNRTIAWAVDLAKKNDAIEIQTLGYRQDPLYKNKKITGWKVRQSIRLESTDTAALTTLVGELQDRLSVASLQYTISSDVRAKVENTLIMQALESFERRGKVISEKLGRPDYRIVNMNIITSGATPVPVRMRAVAAMAESSRVTPPTVEPGVQSVTVQISGTVELEVR
jgi:predicted secreted protein